MKVALAGAALLGALAVLLGLVLSRGDDGVQFRGSTPPEGLAMPAAAYDVEPALQGKAVAVTFLDTQCTEACPIVARQIGEAMRLLGRERGQVLAVAFSVDPVNDTPTRVRAFLDRYGATEDLRYVSGTVAELRPVWDGFKILPSVDTKDSNMHSAPVRVYDDRGQWRSTLHPGVDLSAANLAHDLQTALDT